LPPLPWTVIGAVAFVTVLLLRDFVLFGRAFFERDIQTHWYAQATAFVSAVTEGAWPVWDPSASFGEPIWAYPTQVAYPTTWLNLVMAPWQVYTTTVVLHLLLSGLGLYALARRHEVSQAGALTGACAWVACGPLFSTVNMINNIIGAAWLPWIALAAATALASGRAFHGVLWGASLAAPVLAGSEAAFMGGLLTAADALRRVAWRDPLGPGNRRLARVAGTALFFALSLSALQWVPTLELTGRTSRQALSRELRTDGSLDVLSLAQVVVPFDLQGLPFEDHGTGGLLDTQTFLGSLHLGVPLLALALSAFTSPHRRRAWFLAGTAVVATGFALGRYGPLYDPLVVAIPLLRAIRFPVKAMLLVALCVCLLAAMGLDGWRTPGTPGPRWKRWVVVPSAALTLVAALILSTLVLGGEALGRQALVQTSNAPSPAELLAPRLPALVAGNAAALAVFGLALTRGRNARARWLAPAVALMAIGQLVAFHWNLHPSAPRQLYRYCPVSASELGRPDARLYSRTLIAATGWRRPPPGMPPEIATALTVRDYLVPQVAAVCGFRGSFGRDVKNIEPPFVTALTRRLEADLGSESYLRLLQVAGVTHVATLDDPGLPALRPVASHETVFGDRVQVLEVPEALPRTFVTDGVRLAAGREALDTLVDPGFDPRREIVLAAGRAREAGATPAGTSRIQVARSDRVVIEAEMRRPGHVVLLDVFDEWWRAEVDGITTPVERADVAFRAVRVDAGRHEVVFRHQSRPIVIGLGWSTLALALAVGLGIRHWFGRQSLAREHCDA
jgi:hypothetical protein